MGAMIISELHFYLAESRNIIAHNLILVECKNICNIKIEENMA